MQSRAGNEGVKAMREIKKEIEQLEEVATQLGKQTPTGARLALLLLDNSVELLAYKKVREIFALDSMYKSPDRPPKYSPDKRKKVKEHFKDKVNFLVFESNYISHDEGEVLKVGHDLRNEAYHKGVLRDSIIISVTSVYFGIACNLFPRLWIGSYSYTPNDDVAGFLNNYGIKGSMIDHEAIRKICDGLLDGRNCTVENLGIALSEDLCLRIDEFEEILESHQHDVRPEMSPEWLLKEMQFSQTFPGDLEFPQTHEGFLAFHKAREEHFSKFKPPITLKTIERWKKKALKIRSGIEPGAILRQFAEIDTPLLEIEDILYSAVAEFDAYINSRVHS